MNNRIKEVRKALRLTQADFGKKLNVTNNYIYLIESGSNPVTDNLIFLICNVFKVNEEWLRTGLGEMFAPKDREAEIAEIVEAIYTNDDPFRRNLIKLLAEMDEDQINLLKGIALKLAEIVKEEKE